MYVVCGYFRYQDCSENSSELVETVDDGLLWMKKHSNDSSCMASFRMFKVGEEILVTQEVVEEPQPAKKSVKYKVKS